MEKLLHEAEVAIAADERRLEARGPLRSARACHDAEGAPRLDRLRLALQLAQTAVGIDDGRLRSAFGRVTDDDGPRLGARLQTRSGVDKVPRNEPFARIAGHHRRLAGEDAAARPELGDAHSLAEICDGLDQLEGGSNRTLDVVFARDRRAPDGHNGVTNELLHRAAVALDDSPARVEVACQEFANLLRVPRLRERREADEIGEQ